MVTNDYYIFFFYLDLAMCTLKYILDRLMKIKA